MMLFVVMEHSGEYEQSISRPIFVASTTKKAECWLASQEGVEYSDDMGKEGWHKKIQRTLPDWSFLEGSVYRNYTFESYSIEEVPSEIES